MGKRRDRDEEIEDREREGKLTKERGRESGGKVGKSEDLREERERVCVRER
jgi:hypothetical protein